MKDNKIKLAIIGASYLQDPLIKKAKSRGIETHVFAWAVGDVGEQSADFFYPISITEKEKILEKCREIDVDGICTIASDLAAITVGYVSNNLGLIGNSMKCIEKSTNKHLMRKCFEENGDPSPKSIKVISSDDLRNVKLEYPIIVKPIDRSGSRGITKLDSAEFLEQAIERAKNEGFEKAALVEEYASGQEYSVEYISWKGQHYFLALTKKYTSGPPKFIETGHIEPAPISNETLERVKNIVEHALDSLEIEYGASHTELKISKTGDIKLIEIGGRMGGDNIGAALVEMSTGYNFLGGVIDVALGIEPKIHLASVGAAGIRFIFSENDLEVLKQIKTENPEILVEENIREITSHEINDSGSRFGYFMFGAKSYGMVEKYMP